MKLITQTFISLSSFLLFQITMTLSGTDTMPVDLSALNEIQAVSALVRAVQKMITDTKRNILKLEADINNPNA